MRHITGWEPTPATMNEPPGWISPSGRYYAGEHQDWEPPHWPDGLLPGGQPSAAPLDGGLPEPPPGVFAEATFPFAEPPDEEPPAEHLINDAHEAGNILYSTPITRPPDPRKDWEVALY